MDFFIEPEQTKDTFVNFANTTNGKYSTTIRYLHVDKKLEKILNKKQGDYISIFCKEFSLYDTSTYEYLTKTIIKMINKILTGKKPKKFLIVGIGNSQIVADSLGPKTIDKIVVTGDFSSSVFSNVWALTPSVFAKTGIATADIVKQTCNIVKPDVVILIDVLSCNNIEYLGKSIQLSTNITPGGGVGNKQPTINQNYVGCPTLVLGVPLIINGNLLGVDRQIFLTTKDIDELVVTYSNIIATAVNKYAHKNFSYEQIIKLMQK